MFAEDTEPFSPEAMRSRRPAADEPISRRMVGAVGGPLEAGERDRFRGPFEEEEDAQIVEDDGDGDTFVDPDAEIEEDADATQLVKTPKMGLTHRIRRRLFSKLWLTSFFLDHDDMLIDDPRNRHQINVLTYIDEAA